jgi:predicted membrane-bound mannosyltransferase
LPLAIGTVLLAWRHVRVRLTDRSVSVKKGVATRAVASSCHRRSAIVDDMRHLAALLVLAVAVAGCGPTAAERSAGTPETAEESSATAGQAGASPFGTVEAVGGGQIQGANLAGRDLALWFWAPW